MSLYLNSQVLVSRIEKETMDVSINFYSCTCDFSQCGHRF